MENNTCSLKEVQDFSNNLTKDVNVDNNLKQIIGQIKKYKGMSGGGKYSPMVIHSITVVLLTGVSITSVQASMYAIQASGLANAIYAYQGLSEAALYGCNSAVGVGVRQVAADYISPYIGCGWNTAQIEMANKQIIIFLRFIYNGVAPLVDLSLGFKGYNMVYSAVDTFLQNNEPPCPMNEFKGGDGVVFTATSPETKKILDAIRKGGKKTKKGKKIRNTYKRSKKIIKSCRQKKYHKKNKK